MKVDPGFLREQFFSGDVFEGLRALIEARGLMSESEWLDLVHESACDLLYSGRSPAFALALAEELTRMLPESISYLELAEEARASVSGVRTQREQPQRLTLLVEKVADGERLTEEELTEVLTLLSRKPHE